MKTRDIAILIGLGFVVLAVAWYFLIIGPKRNSISDTEAALQKEKSTYEDNAEKVKRIDEERTAAKQTSGEILKYNKLIPADSQVPSLIVELQQSAMEAGIKFMSIKPSEAVAGTDGTTIIPFEMAFQGNFFDVNDFLYRIENYARMSGNDVNVTGRLLSVVTISLDEPELDAQFPQVLATLGVNAYTTAPPPAPTTRSARSSESSGTEGGSGSAAAGAGG